jgi:hypothetical protein
LHATVLANEFSAALAHLLQVLRVVVTVIPEPEFGDVVATINSGSLMS